uniref:Uncharacterized protein n=1 Tax=Vombatus ursinus TaxID=29139 RepID=A0A4X2L1N6_VOMUR
MLPAPKWLSHHLGPAVLEPGVSSILFLALLALGSWILVKGLTFVQRYYVNCQRLRCFPQPPLKHWFFGHLGLVTSDEEIVQFHIGESQHFRDVCCWWVGAWCPVIRIFHPSYIKPVLLASGRLLSSLIPRVPLPSQTV